MCTRQGHSSRPDRFQRQDMYLSKRGEFRLRRRRQCFAPAVCAGRLAKISLGKRRDSRCKSSETCSALKRWHCSLKLEDVGKKRGRLLQETHGARWGGAGGGTGSTGTTRWVLARWSPCREDVRGPAVHQAPSRGPWALLCHEQVTALSGTIASSH